ncbi:endolytic transglycosylase MltG [Paraliobacillus salinarum]|uniref:endolytic transglycosylase MltG n=1 Tax=Paraliobacillus salinarum TaxID=1158996 RepID=UPI0015F3BBF9|nr:endolytic transglycosylase MltG [Paraliobacillus salinarum]
MKQIIRAFASGLLLASVIIGIIYFLETDAKEENKPETISIEEMKQTLESEGYTVSTEESKEKTNEKNADTNKQPQENDKTTGNKESKEIRIYTLTIESGMTISEVSDALAEAKIIKDSTSFVSYLQDNGYGTAIQIGKFELTDRMTLEQIARTIANKN